MISKLTPRCGWLASLLLCALCWAGGCAVDPAVLGRTGQEGNTALDGQTRQPGRQSSGKPGAARTELQGSRSAAGLSRQSAANSPEKLRQPLVGTEGSNRQEASQRRSPNVAVENEAAEDRIAEEEVEPSDSGTVHRLTDSNIPNPLRRNESAKGPTAAANGAAANPAKQPTVPPRSQYPVQTVGFQEEIPIVQGERIPGGAAARTRLAMLEEPDPAVTASSSVLEESESNLPAVSAEPETIEFVSPPVAPALPLEEEAAQDPAGNGLPPGGNPANAESLPAGGVGAAQGHYQQGTPAYGQLLNQPQQTASQKALQLMDENKQLREEMKEKLKSLESMQARLKQQDELWTRARQEFLEVRTVVDNLSRENSLLKMQIEQLEGEKVELAKQYQNLMQTVEQTLDDLLLKAITEPPPGNPRATAPATTPATTPAGLPFAPPSAAPPAAAPPVVAPPIIPGQQASSKNKSPR